MMNEKDKIKSKLEEMVEPKQDFWSKKDKLRMGLNLPLYIIIGILIAVLRSTFEHTLLIWIIGICAIIYITFMHELLMVNIMED